MTSYYLFQGHRNQRTGAEREARNIALDWYFWKQKTRNTMRDTSSIASADFSYYHYFFFFFFFFVYTPSWKGRPASNKQCHDKEKKFRSSGKHWWASRSHIGPFVAFYAFHSPFSHPFTSSSFHTRSRPVFPIYRFIVVYLRFVAHASRESWFTVNFLFECWPHFSLPRLRLSRDFSRYWPRSLRLTGIDCSNRGNAKFNPWTTNYNVNLLVKIICNNRTKSERF